MFTDNSSQSWLIPNCLFKHTDDMLTVQCYLEMHVCSFESDNSQSGITSVIPTKILIICLLDQSWN